MKGGIKLWSIEGAVLWLVEDIHLFKLFNFRK